MRMRSWGTACCDMMHVGRLLSLRAQTLGNLVDWSSAWASFQKLLALCPIQVCGRSLGAKYNFILC